MARFGGNTWVPDALGIRHEALGEEKHGLREKLAAKKRGTIRGAV